eukprot:scaffold52766_cov21-Tisochrysis_lutea.AAC.1
MSREPKWSKSTAQSTWRTMNKVHPYNHGIHYHHHCQRPMDLLTTSQSWIQDVWSFFCCVDYSARLCVRGLKVAGGTSGCV